MGPQINKYTDPKTGEIIHKCFMPEFHQKNIEEGINIHQGNMNQFLMASQQYFGILSSVIELKKKIELSDKEIKDRLQFACKQVGISSQEPWNYNMIEKVFELREPPAILPISNDLLGGYEVLDKGAGNGKI